MIAAIVVLIVFTVLLVITVIQLTGDLRRTEDALRHVQARHANQDALLDCILEHYGLNTDEPYVARPGFAEQRCFHRLHPLGSDHAPTCIWQTTRPHTRPLL